MLFEQYPEAVIEKDSSGCLPLHHACHHPASKDVISFLLAHNPWASREKRDDKYTPLHLACRHGPSLEVVELKI